MSVGSRRRWDTYSRRIGCARMNRFCACCGSLLYKTRFRDTIWRARLRALRSTRMKALPHARRMWIRNNWQSYWGSVTAQCPPACCIQSTRRHTCAIARAVSPAHTIALSISSLGSRIVRCIRTTCYNRVVQVAVSNCRIVSARGCSMRPSAVRTAVSHSQIQDYSPRECCFRNNCQSANIVRFCANIVRVGQ